ncbi:MAG: hypothetical protein JSR26_04675 [Proteobacteria bacterium]|nr:hypothetical protein [Pseudomonadota bacterium]
MDWIEAINHWRSLPPEAQQRRRLANLPRKAARSMAFAGEPAPDGWVEGGSESCAKMHKVRRYFEKTGTT